MFQQSHTTAAGDTMLIAQMEDSHLVNMLGLIVKRAEDAVAAFNRVVIQNEQYNSDPALPWNTAQRKIYGLQPPPSVEQSAAEYGKTIAELSAKIEPYLMEAWTRDWSSQNEEAVFGDLRLRWQSAVGRSSAIPNHNPNRQLLGRRREAVLFALRSVDQVDFDDFDSRNDDDDLPF